MRSRLALLVLATSLPAAALEVDTDVGAGREFLYATTDVQGSLLDGQLVLGGGAELHASAGAVRAGGRLLLGWEGDEAGASLRVGWAPPQGGRGWLTVEPEARWSHAWERLALTVGLRLAWRRVDAELARERLAPVEQLQVVVEPELDIAHRYMVSLTAVRSAWEPGLGGHRRIGLDVGPAVTIAGGPERWAVGGRFAIAACAVVTVAAGATVVEFADTGGRAAAPRASIRAGPFAGISFEAGGAWLLPFTGPAERSGPMAELALHYER